MTLDQPFASVIEAALLAAGRPLPVKELLALFPDDLFVNEEDRPQKDDILRAIEVLKQEYAGRSFEIVEVASGFRLQVRQGFSKWLNSLWEEKSTRYSRALLETLAIIAYRQPVTRGEIEDIRGVAVSTNIIRTLDERSWVRVVGHRDVPGRPAMYGTTKEFLDYFQLKSLDELPSLSEIRDLDSLNHKLDLEEFAQEGIPAAPISVEVIEDASEEMDDSDELDELDEDEEFDADEVSEVDETEEGISAAVDDQEHPAMKVEVL